MARIMFLTWALVWLVLSLHIFPIWWSIADDSVLSEPCSMMIDWSTGYIDFWSTWYFYPEKSGYLCESVLLSSDEEWQDLGERYSNCEEISSQEGG